MTSWFNVLILFACVGITFAKFSEWNEWSACSSSCNNGKSTRERILKPHGGDYCYSAIVKHKDCRGYDCTRASNIAKGKPTASSSNLFKLYPSNLAVDGKKYNQLSQKSCMHTEKDKNPWLRIDLQKDSAVKKIIIYNRGDCCQDRLNNLYVTVGSHPDGTNNAVCGRLGNLTFVNQTVINCNNVLSGRYVHLRIPGPQYLHICEVEIIGAALRDLSRKRPVLLSSTSSAANRAIDGNSASAAISKLQQNPFWRIDLGGEYYIIKMKLTSNAQYVFNETVFTVGNDASGKDDQICAITKSNENFDNLEIVCRKTMKGRFVRLTQKGSNILRIGEINIFGY